MKLKYCTSSPAIFPMNGQQSLPQFLWPNSRVTPFPVILQKFL